MYIDCALGSKREEVKIAYFTALNSKISLPQPSKEASVDIAISGCEVFKVFPLVCSMFSTHL